MLAHQWEGNVAIKLVSQLHLLMEQGNDTLASDVDCGKLCCTIVLVEAILVLLILDKFATIVFLSLQMKPYRGHSALLDDAMSTV